MKNNQVWIYVIALIIVLVAVIAAFLMYKTNREDYPSPLDTFRPVEFSTISKDTPIIKKKDNETLIFRDESNFVNWWRSSFQFSQRPPTPVINFSESIVIIAFSGERNTGGHNIEVIEIKESSNRVEVTIEETSPGENCIVAQALTYPYHIIQTKQTDKEFDFDIQKEVRDCVS